MSRCEDTRQCQRPDEDRSICRSLGLLLSSPTTGFTTISSYNTTTLSTPASSTSPPVAASTATKSSTTVAAASFTSPSVAASAASTATKSSTTIAAASTTSPPVAESGSSSTATATHSANVAIASSSNAATIAGSVIGAVIFLVLVALALLLYLRARKKKRTAPSSEFLNSIRAGAAPVFRLESGAEYTPALSEKVGGYTHSPTTASLPFLHNSYYTSPPTKFRDEVTDVPSERPSIDKPLHPQRYSSQQQVSEPFIARHYPGASIGSRRELWGSDTEVGSSEFARQSPAHTDSVLHFAPRYSLDDPSSHHLHSSYSPPPLQPLRRQPDLDGI